MIFIGVDVGKNGAYAIIMPCGIIAETMDSFAEALIMAEYARRKRGGKHE